MIVIPTQQQARPGAVSGRTVEHIFRKAPCDVMIYRPAPGIGTAVWSRRRPATRRRSAREGGRQEGDRVGETPRFTGGCRTR
jgi:hypothetical protein